MSVTRSITIPAQIGSTPGVYTERGNFQFFFCISASADCFVQFGSEVLQPVKSGVTATGNAKRITLTNTSSSAVDVVFNAGDKPYVGQAQVSAISNTVMTASVPVAAYSGLNGIPQPGLTQGGIKLLDGEFTLIAKTILGLNVRGFVVTNTNSSAAELSLRPQNSAGTLALETCDFILAGTSREFDERYKGQAWYIHNLSGSTITLAVTVFLELA